MILKNKQLKKRVKRQVIENEDVDNYYKQKVKPISKEKWEYLLTRKAWYVMPLGWDNIALLDCQQMKVDGDLNKGFHYRSYVFSKEYLTQRWFSAFESLHDGSFLRTFC